MPKAIWNDAVLADSDATLEAEGNIYFPASSVNQQYFIPSDHTTVCGWKGTASYYDIKVGDEINENAAWVYTDPKHEAAHLKNFIAFWNGVQVSA
jgi:uncharacterized protein (DUF427 family)